MNTVTSSYLNIRFQNHVSVGDFFFPDLVQMVPEWSKLVAI